MSNFTIYDHALTGMNNVNFDAFGLSYSGETIAITDNSTPGLVTYAVSGNPSVDQFMISYTSVDGGYIINDIVATYDGIVSFEAHNVGEFVTVDQVVNNDLFSNIPLGGFNTFNGNSYNDIIDAGGGNDVVYGNGGNDTIYGSETSRPSPTSAATTGQPSARLVRSSWGCAAISRGQTSPDPCPSSTVGLWNHPTGKVA
jgi:Ca2+-binding RTX toxin-like protein